MKPLNGRHEALAVAALALALLVTGCASRKADAPAGVDSHVRSQALIDSGNVAFKAKDYEGAARRYASAVAVEPDDPAAHYGLGMSLSRLGRDDEARVAYARARALMGRRVDSLPPGR